MLKFLYSDVCWRRETDKKEIFLTFDDGPIPEITPWVLDTLEAFQVKATFFCIGENVQKYPDIFREIVSRGHQTGNHTFNHLNGWKTKNELYFDNIKKCASLVDSKLFRPPYGKMKRSQYSILTNTTSSKANQLTINHLACRQAGSPLTIVMWDVLSGDFDTNTSPEKCLKNVIQNTRNGSIVVFHDSIKAKKNLQFAMPRYIEESLRKGYFFRVLN